MIYCPKCKETLCAVSVDGVQRLGCSSKSCNFVFWGNPTPVAAALVVHEGLFLLARNAQWPAGRFSLITGFVEKGEVPEQTIVRELQEEVGLVADSVKFVGHFSLEKFNQLLMAYVIQAHGELRLNEEIEEVIYVSAKELADFDFGPFALTKEIVDRVRRMGLACSYPS